MKVIKRNGTEVPFDYTKIKNAIEAANACVAEKDRLSDTMVGFIVGNVEKRCDALGRAVSVEEIQDMIVDELDQSEHTGWPGTTATTVCAMNCCVSSAAPMPRFSPCCGMIQNYIECLTMMD